MYKSNTDLELCRAGFPSIFHQLCSWTLTIPFFIILSHYQILIFAVSTAVWGLFFFFWKCNYKYMCFVHLASYKRWKRKVNGEQNCAMYRSVDDSVSFQIIRSLCHWLLRRIAKIKTQLWLHWYGAIKITENSVISPEPVHFYGVKGPWIKSLHISMGHFLQWSSWFKLQTECDSFFPS